MIRHLLFTAVVSLGFSSLTCAEEITGAGSTFVNPIMAKWAAAYKAETGVAVNYQSIGSGGGIKQIQAKTVDFGATDMPLKPEELKTNDLVQFPIVNGAIVPVVNLKGVKPGELKLNGSLLAGIFLGKVKKWNDPAIVALNPSAKLSDLDITVVHRADGSGTSFIFTNYLSKVSADWKSSIGEGTAPQWPVGIGGKGNEGVANFVQKTNGAIGYVEYAYAATTKMTYTQMENHAHKFIAPDDLSFAAAAQGANWAGAPGFYLIMTDSAGEKSWPIAGSTFILMQKTQSKAQQGTDALKFFKWAYAHGEASAKELHYVPIPKKIAESVQTQWKEQIKGIEFNKSW